MIQCKFGALKFLVLKKVTTLVYVLIIPMGIYYKVNFNFNNDFTYILVFMNISMGW